MSLFGEEHYKIIGNAIKDILNDENCLSSETFYYMFVRRISDMFQEDNLEYTEKYWQKFSRCFDSCKFD